MKKEEYISVANYFNKRKRLLRAALIFQKSAEVFIYAAYPVFLIWLAFSRNPFFWRSVISCGVGFVAVSLARRLINAERPYKKYGFTPLIKKETEGNSMPSRHCFSASVIAVNISAVFLPLGVFIGVLAVMIAVLRVLFGVHFIRDVAVGLIIGLVVGATVFI